MGKYIQYLEGHLQHSSRYFNLEHSSVMNMFDYYMSSKIECKKIDKINILIYDSDTHSIEISDFANQAFISLSIPFREFENLTKTEARELFAKQLLEALIQFSDIYEVDKSHFVNCFETLKQKDFLFNDELITTRKNKHTIKIVFECDTTYRIYLIDTISNSKILFLELPLGTKGLLKFYIKKVKWTPSGQLLIYHSNNRDYWEYSPVTQELCFHYPRAESGDPHGQYDLGLMYQNGKGVLKDEEKSIYWLKKAAAQGYSRAIKKLEDTHPNLD